MHPIKSNSGFTLYPYGKKSLCKRSNFEMNLLKFSGLSSISENFDGSPKTTYIKVRSIWPALLASIKSIALTDFFKEDEITC